MMQKSKSSPTRIAGVLKVNEGGKSGGKITQENGASKASLDKWKQRYGGIEATSTAGNGDDHLDRTGLLAVRRKRDATIEAQQQEWVKRCISNSETLSVY